jgi:hypothetical protein
MQVLVGDFPYKTCTSPVVFEIGLCFLKLFCDDVFGFLIPLAERR